MKKLLAILIALTFVAGMAYASEGEKCSSNPVKTMVDDTGKVIKTTAEGVADTLDVPKNEPITTAVKATGKVAEQSVKTVTFQKIDDTSKSTK